MRANENFDSSRETQSREVAGKVEVPNLKNVLIVSSARKQDWVLANVDNCVPVSKVPTEIVLCPVCDHAICVCENTPVSGIR